MIIYISASRQQRIIVAAMHWLQVKTMPIQNIAVFVFETSSNMFKIYQKKNRKKCLSVFISESENTISNDFRKWNSRFCFHFLKSKQKEKNSAPFWSVLTRMPVLLDVPKTKTEYSVSLNPYRRGPTYYRDRGVSLDEDRSKASSSHVSLLSNTCLWPSQISSKQSLIKSFICRSLLKVPACCVWLSTCLQSDHFLAAIKSTVSSSGRGSHQPSTLLALPFLLFAAPPLASIWIPPACFTLQIGSPLKHQKQNWSVRIESWCPLGEGKQLNLGTPSEKCYGIIWDSFPT